MKVSGKDAVVMTGGGGIGAALSAGLAEQGAQLVLADLDPQRTGEVASSVGASPWPRMRPESRCRRS